MTNLEIIMNTEAFKTYILDPENLYEDARSLDKWQLVRKELLEKGFKVDVCTWDLKWAWIKDTINELPQIVKE